MTTMFIGNRGAMWAGLPVHNVSRCGRSSGVRGPRCTEPTPAARATSSNNNTKTAAELNGLEAGLGWLFDSRDAWMQYGRQSGGTLVWVPARGVNRRPAAGTISADAQTGLDALRHQRKPPWPL